MKKIVTIAIPTYNMEQYLDRCLSSLLIKNIELLNTAEVLVINDGSKDKSLEIARSYEEKFPDVFRVIDKPNGNYGSCLNRAIKEATGKYFRTLDADDWYDTDAFEQYLKVLKDEKDNTDLIITNEIPVHGDKKGQPFQSEAIVGKVYKFDVNLLKSNLFNMFIQTSTYRTDIVRHIAISERISYTDMEVRYLTIPYIKTCKVYKDIHLYQYFIGREGQSVSVDSYIKNCQHMNTIISRYIDETKKYASDSEMMEMLFISMRALIVMYYKVCLFFKVSDANYNAFTTLHWRMKEEHVPLYTLISQLEKHHLKYVKMWEKHPRLCRYIYRLMGSFV